MAQTAYKMVFLKEEAIGTVIEIPGGTAQREVVALNFKTECYVADALFTSRLYARVLEGEAPDAEVIIRMDTELMGKDDLSKFFLKPTIDGDSPYRWRNNLLVFQAVSLFSEQADPKNQHGLMLTNGMWVDVRIYVRSCKAPVKIEVGLVAATYSTREVKGPRLQVIDRGDPPKLDALTMVKAGAYLIDVRTPEEFASIHVEEAVNCPLQDLKEANFEGLPVQTDVPLVVICKTGLRAEIAVEILKANGYTRLTNAGGMDDWIVKGWPLKVRVDK
jgi:rhodanese-related sulfurtransferase